MTHRYAAYGARVALCVGCLVLSGVLADSAAAQRPRSLKSRFAAAPRAARTARTAGPVRSPRTTEVRTNEVSMGEQQMAVDQTVGDWEGGTWEGDAWDEGTCETCGDQQCSTGGCGHSGAWLGGADYLYVRPTFSEAIGYVQSTFNGNDLSQIRHPYNFGYKSSVRAFLGYRLCDCGGEIRFTYTNLRGDAQLRSPVATGTTIYTGQLEINTGQGESLVSRADVDTNTYDIDFSKSIPIGAWGGGCQTGCSVCPRWDVQWSAGVRIADVDIDNGTWITDGESTTASGHTNTSLTGAGPRLGLLGRRALGQGGWLSVFARGNISLLLSNYEVDARRVTTGASGSTQTESLSMTRVIPVTEIEVGTTVRLAPRTTLVAGYLFQTWNDMGITQGIGGNLPSFDTANNLSFDGFFLRGEWTY